ncbi:MULTISPECIES: amino acid ABC transporter permease [unclassified Variovorax]|uniref:amino acid ABC transporter permease n=1 Tax=unclassified Variovorax TaxID=663243 RepID=UPI003F45F687
MEERIKLHVDLDVHKDGISVAVAEPGRAPGRLIGKVTHHASRITHHASRITQSGYGGCASAALGLTLNAVAFLGEIWRGCIESVPHGQDEASKALGPPNWLRMALVPLPQAARIAIAPTMGFLVQLIKNTSLAASIAFVELTRSGQIVNNATFRPLTVFLVVAAIYFCICWPLSWYSQRLERRLQTGARFASHLQQET